MASPTDNNEGFFSDVRKVGYLRKPKSMHKRFFVLRAASESGPARLEYYENEKKWRHKSGAPKRSIPLESCFNINKRADSKNKHLVALYTKDEHFAIAADSEPEQESWYQALLQLHNRAKGHHHLHHHHHHHHSDVTFGGSSAGLGEAGEDGYGEVAPGPAFKEVWQVILKPKGLGQTKNLIGIYRLCLTNKTISFVKLNSDAAAVVLQLLNIRRCGHSENFFFIEVGRSAVTGPGEFWMQVDDSVVAQNMHETILEAMRAMSEEFRPRSKSQSSSNCSNPISVPLRSRHHVNNPPPSQVGLSRRSRTESVTATSPAGGGGGGTGGKPSSFRVRASSDGEGTMSRPASVDGSPVSPSANRTHSHRHRGSSRLHPPLNHSRSIPMPSSRCSPSATSPVSLSSSSTSGHGSTSDCLFPRRSSASVSGSPSDGGFISSDEYGSSPCDFRSSFRSVTPDSLGHTPPARGDEELNYICMGGKATPSCCSLAAPNGHFIPRTCHPQQQPRYSSMPRGGSEEVADLEKAFRKRTHSAGTSPTISHQKTPSQSSVASIEEYTEMLPSYPCGSSRLPSYRHSAFVPTHSYPEECLEMHHLDSGHHRTNSAPHMDDGYMPMSPGVAPVPSGEGPPKGGDYMPMSPKSVSAPQQIINPGRGGRHPPATVDSNGYMMMSPSSSYSPDSGSTGYGKIWTNGAGHHPKLSVESNEGKLPCGGSDYINMSPASGSTTSTPPDCYFGGAGQPGIEEAAATAHHKPIYSYFSLPRSFKHVHRRGGSGPAVVGEEGSPQPRIALGSGRLLCAAEDSSSSTSSDSLGGVGGGTEGGPPLQAQPPRKVDTAVQTNKGRLARPTRLSLGGPKASTLPRAREQPPLLLPPEPKSPGEYVNIEFIAGDKPPFPSAALGLGLPPPGNEGAEEYMNMELGPPRAPCPAAFVAARAAPAARPGRGAAPGGRDYVTMQLGGAAAAGGSCSDCADSPSPSSPALLLSYADVRAGRSAAEKPPPAAAPTASPELPRPPAELSVAPPRSSSLLGGPGAGSAFTRVSLSPGRNQSAKPGAGAAPALENGLNYIDLDLVKDCSHRRHHLHPSAESAALPGGKQPPPKAPGQPRGSGHASDDLSAYASISFQKREEM
ncbi:insulin receptor substrate 1 isoform A [Patagioenas fasciata monilis]|uniref:Insulin receptor substrate 1 isoform A n=1 Tax=Patagioenas fasciata monilis TaxID=372326 RepID=A0A1V4K3V1_PATFA|nr:insulin receptor substrate 1 isoform A [Patagioenas fasciata monilis]